MRRRLSADCAARAGSRDLSDREGRAQPRTSQRAVAFRSSRRSAAFAVSEDLAGLAVSETSFDSLALVGCVFGVCSIGDSLSDAQVRRLQPKSTPIGVRDGPVASSCRWYREELGGARVPQNYLQLEWRNAQVLWRIPTSVVTVRLAITVRSGSDQFDDGRPMHRRRV